VRVQLAPQVPCAAFEWRLRLIPAVLSAALITGAVLAADVPLPADIRPGDLLAVPGTGAYTQSMASNYNLVGRPPVIAVRDGAARLLIRRETTTDLLVRDIGM